MSFVFFPNLLSFLSFFFPPRFCFNEIIFYEERRRNDPRTRHEIERERWMKRKVIRKFDNKPRNGYTFSIVGKREREKISKERGKREGREEFSLNFFSYTHDRRLLRIINVPHRFFFFCFCVAFYKN